MINSLSQSSYSASTAGTVFVVQGNAGNVEGHSTELAVNNSWTASFNDQQYGYATLAVNAASGIGTGQSLLYTMYAADSGKVMDSFTVFAKSQAVTGGAGAALGDPQIVGFLGQSFQVHGLDGGVYSVISDEETQLNARFVFLSSGSCPPVSVLRTQCWSHSGSYFGEVAVQSSSGARLLVQSGAAADGLSLLQLDGQTLELTGGAANLSSADGSLTVRLYSRWQLHVTVGVYELEMDNSDRFLNLAAVRVRDWSRLSQRLQPHGLLGQTWRRSSAGLEVRQVEGLVDDYLEADSDIFGSRFLFNKFKLSRQ